MKTRHFGKNILSLVIMGASAGPLLAQEAEPTDFYSALDEARGEKDPSVLSERWGTNLSNEELLSRMKTATIVDSDIKEAIRESIAEKLSDKHDDFIADKNGVRTKDSSLPDLEKTDVMFQYLTRGVTGVTALEKHFEPGEFPFMYVNNICHGYDSDNPKGMTKVQLAVLSERGKDGVLRISKMDFATGPGFVPDMKAGYIPKTYYGVDKVGPSRGLHRNWVSSPTSKEFFKKVYSGKASVGNIRSNKKGDRLYADVHYKGAPLKKVTIGRGKHKIDEGEWTRGTTPRVPDTMEAMFGAQELWSLDTPFYNGAKRWGINYGNGRGANHTSASVAKDSDELGSHGCFRSGICMNISGDLAMREKFLATLKKEAPKLRAQLIEELSQKLPDAGAAHIESVVDREILSNFGVKSAAEQESWLAGGGLTQDRLENLMTEHVKHTDQIALSEGREKGINSNGEEYTKREFLRPHIKNVLHEAAFKELRAKSFYAFYDNISREELGQYYKEKQEYFQNVAAQELVLFDQAELLDPSIKERKLRTLAIDRLRNDDGYKELVDAFDALGQPLAMARQQVKDAPGFSSQKRAAKDHLKRLESREAILMTQLDGWIEYEVNKLRAGNFGSSGDVSIAMAELEKLDDHSANKYIRVDGLKEQLANKKNMLATKYLGLSEEARDALIKADLYRIAYEREIGTVEEPGRFGEGYAMPEEHKAYLLNNKANFYAAYLNFLEREYIHRHEADRPECNEHIEQVRSYLARLGGSEFDEITPEFRPHAPIEPTHSEQLSTAQAN